MQVSNKWRSRAIAAVILLAVVGGGVWWWQSSPSADTPRFRTARLEQGPITAVVSSSGTLNPVTSVQVGTQVSGQVKNLYVDFNSPVKQGELIARIDPETFEYRVRQVEADLEAARSNEGRAKVALANAKRELARTQELVARNFVSGAELDAKQATYDLAAADLKNAQAVIRQREASLASARVDLGRTEIRAPVNGVVIKRSVDVGQTVAASLQAPELFLIAKDLRDMQVETSIDEADVGRVKPGQKASFTVDAFPGRSFNGEIRQVRKAALNQSGVITYTALVSAANPDGILMPGMTANVRITTDSRADVLKAPNAALRFRPPGEAAAKPEARPATRGASDASGGRSGPSARGRVWVLGADGKPKAVEVRTGLSDGSATEISGEGLVAGTDVLTGVLGGNGTAASAPNRSGPRMPF